MRDRPETHVSGLLFNLKFWRKIMAKKKFTEEELYMEIASKSEGQILSQLDNCKFFIDTGCLAANYVCSGMFAQGGIPGNRITEIYGPSASGKSLIANNVLYGCQKMGGWAVILDCENATNAEWMAKASHINPNLVLRYTPFTLEDAFLKIHNVVRLIRSREADLKRDRKPIVIVYDSISVSPCRREFRETELPEEYNPTMWKKIVGAQEQPGERAKIIGKELRKLLKILEKDDVTLVVINQTREKIGVLYGCFDYNSRVTMADGSSMKIGKIVNSMKRKEDFEVLSFNIETKCIEPKKVLNGFDNGKLNVEHDEHFLRFKARKFSGNGVTQFACTPNHTIITPDKGEVSASELEVGDHLLIAQPKYLSNDQKQIVYGSILGDGNIKEGKKIDSCSSLRVCHGLEQKEYCQWKEEILNPWIANSREVSKHKQYRFRTIPMYELTRLKFRNDNLCIIPKEVSDNLDLLGLAIWYMDDGTFAGNYLKWGNGKSTIYCKKFKNREIMFEAFARFGLNPKLNKKGFSFNSEETKKLHTLISKYVPPCMNYKIHPNFREKFNFQINEVDEDSLVYEAVPAEILDIYRKPNSVQLKKYDLEIEGNHTYLVDGSVVHNSPETRPGGKALEFYASLIIRTQQKKKIEHKDLKTYSGTNMEVKNVKNRSFRPFIKTEGVKLYFDAGINPLTGILTLLIEDERITGKSGNFTVVEEYAGSLDKPYKFKSSLERNDVPIEVLLDNPKLIDLETREDVIGYFEPFQGAIDHTNSGAFEEKKISYDLDGNYLDEDEEME